MRSLIRSVSGGTAPDDAADEESGSWSFQGPPPAARAEEGSALSQSPPAGTESCEADSGNACDRESGQSTDQDEVLAENLSAEVGSGGMDVAEDADAMTRDQEEVDLEEADSHDDIADVERLDETASADGPAARSGGTAHAEQAISLCGVAVDTRGEGASVELAPVDRDETAACSSRESDDGD